MEYSNYWFFVDLKQESMYATWNINWLPCECNSIYKLIFHVFIFLEFQTPWECRKYPSILFSLPLFRWLGLNLGKTLVTRFLKLGSIALTKFRAIIEFMPLLSGHFKLLVKVIKNKNHNNCPTFILIWTDSHMSWTAVKIHSSFGIFLL